MILESFFCHLSQTSVSGQLGSTPLFGRLFRQDDGLQSFGSSRFEWIEIDLEGEFTSGHVFVARDLGGDESIASIGNVDEFVAMRTVLAWT